MEVVLVSYRDAGMRTFTYFWAHKDSNRQFGPFFDTEADAKRWLEETLGKPNSEKG
jgi:hypothetical protein